MTNPLTDKNLHLLASKTPQCYEGRKVRVPYHSNSRYGHTLEEINAKSAKRIALSVNSIASNLLEGDK